MLLLEFGVAHVPHGADDVPRGTDDVPHSVGDFRQDADDPYVLHEADMSALGFDIGHGVLDFGQPPLIGDFDLVQHFAQLDYAETEHVRDYVQLVLDKLDFLQGIGHDVDNCHIAVHDYDRDAHEHELVGHGHEHVRCGRETVLGCHENVRGDESDRDGENVHDAKN